MEGQVYDKFYNWIFTWMLIWCSNHELNGCSKEGG